MPAGISSLAPIPVIAPASTIQLDTRGETDDGRHLTSMWRKFRYERSSGRAEALFRIAFAAVLLLQLLTLRPNIGYFYSTEAIAPIVPGLEAYYTPGLVLAGFWLWFASSALLLVGAFTRVAALVCFLGSSYFLVLRGSQATHAADWLLPSLAFHLVLLPSNRHFALDQRWRKARPADVPAWPARLAQLSTAFFYFTAGTSKLSDPMWRHGQGFFMTFANPMLSHFDLTWLATASVFSPAINYAVMTWECAMPLLLLWRRTRYIALLSAVFFLASIDVTLPVGWFSWFCVANLFVFADVTPWPRVWLQRLPWLAAPPIPTPAQRTAGQRSWQGHAVTAFLAFHLTCFGVLQAAYGLIAAHQFDLGRRLATLPLVGTYGVAIANVHYYALWPSQVFCPIRNVYFEVEERDGRLSALAPFDERGRVHFSWRDSREVREAVFLIGASHGLGSLGWRRLFAHVAATRTESKPCPRGLRAYAVEVWPGRASFDTDLRAGKRFLQRAELRGTTAQDCQLTKITDAAPGLGTGSTTID